MRTSLFALVLSLVVTPAALSAADDDTARLQELLAGLREQRAQLAKQLDMLDVKLDQLAAKVEAAKGEKKKERKRSSRRRAFSLGGGKGDAAAKGKVMIRGLGDDDVQVIELGDGAGNGRIVTKGKVMIKGLGDDDVRVIELDGDDMNIDLGAIGENLSEDVRVLIDTHLKQHGAKPRIHMLGRDGLAVTGEGVDIKGLEDVIVKMDDGVARIRIETKGDGAGAHRHHDHHSGHDLHDVIMEAVKKALSEHDHAHEAGALHEALEKLLHEHLQKHSTPKKKRMKGKNSKRFRMLEKLEKKPKGFRKGQRMMLRQPRLPAPRAMILSTEKPCPALGAPRVISGRTLRAVPPMAPLRVQANVECDNCCTDDNVKVRVKILDGTKKAPQQERSTTDPRIFY